MSRDGSADFPAPLAGTSRSSASRRATSGCVRQLETACDFLQATADRIEWLAQVVRCEAADLAALDSAEALDRAAGLTRIAHVDSGVAQRLAFYATQSDGEGREGG